MNRGKASLGTREARHRVRGGALRPRALRALREAFCRVNPTVELDRAGYVDAARDNLVPAVRLEDFEADVRRGAGGELKCKFRAVHSSTALAVNTFGPYRRRLCELALPGFGPFTQIEFEGRCPTGLGGTAPNLDVLLQGTQEVVGIESKLTEPLRRHRAFFQPSYHADIRDERRRSAWFAEMCRLEKDPDRYHWLNSAQLVKHAFGLARTFPSDTVTLLYLYWEPIGAECFPALIQHRHEIDAFARRVAHSHPRFRAISYAELWRLWSQAPADWLADHIEDLQARYAVAL